MRWPRVGASCWSVTLPRSTMRSAATPTPGAGSSGPMSESGSGWCRRSSRRSSVRRAHPILLARFGLPALLPATSLVRLAFREPAARALFAGMAAHSMLRLGQPMSASFGLVLGLLAHAVGWPVARGGSGAIAAALEAEARSLGVEFVTGHRVDAIADLPPARAVPARRHAPPGAGDGRRPPARRLPPPARAVPLRTRACSRSTGRSTARSPGRTPRRREPGRSTSAAPYREVAASEDAVARGRHADKPYVLLVQPTIADPVARPAGKHVAWAYCHVPNGSTVDMTATIESQVERFAPGFRDLVLARATKDSVAMEAWDANYVGGDINGGIGDWRQLLFRPVVRWNPYTTPDPAVFLCSSSTPPGGGVHGMSGRHAAREVERSLHRR